MSVKPGSKYHPLFEHLQGCDQQVLTLTFAEIETLMGCALPASALSKENWWSNRDSDRALQAKAWVSAGYQVKAVDLSQQIVTFQTFQAAYNVQRNHGEIEWSGAAIKSLRGYKGLNQAQFASELGVRRETVSEWENSKYEPDRSKRKLLDFIAKQAHFDDLQTDL